MTEYGNKEEPGIVTTVTSSATVATSGDAPSDVGLVGQADLSNAKNQADTSRVYQITRASEAVDLFGPTESSLLTQAVVDALNEGAYPVYAVATPRRSSSFDLSTASSRTFQLDNAPLPETTDSVSVTLDGTSLTPSIVYDDVSGYSPSSGECVVNPVRGMVKLPQLPVDGDDTNDTLSYDYFDYESGLDTLVSNAAAVVDFIVPLTENQTVTDYANTKVGTMEDQYDLALALLGADSRVDPSSYEPEYDDSRTQVVYPTRFEDGSSALGAYAGLKARLGLSVTPINKRLSTNRSLAVTLDKAERGSLIDSQVVPLADESRGVRIVDDPTTVSESNSDERNIRYGFNRLVADYIIETTRLSQQPFIGRLNDVTTRNTLKTIVVSNLQRLKESNSVESFEVNIFEVDAVTVGVEMSVNLTDPLRFIENTVTIGGD